MDSSDTICDPPCTSMGTMSSRHARVTSGGARFLLFQFHLCPICPLSQKQQQFTQKSGTAWRTHRSVFDGFCTRSRRHGLPRHRQRSLARNFSRSLEYHGLKCRRSKHRWAVYSRNASDSKQINTRDCQPTSHPVAIVTRSANPSIAPTNLRSSGQQPRLRSPSRPTIPASTVLTHIGWEQGGSLCLQSIDLPDRHHDGQIPCPRRRSTKLLKLKSRSGYFCHICVSKTKQKPLTKHL